MTTLTIISHTEHYKDENGTIVGFGPTVTEINHLLHVFDEIQHVAMLHNKPAPASALPYSSNKITFIALPALGGKKITNKLKIIIQTPKVLSIVAKSVSKTDYFQFRAPTGIGVFIIPYLILFSSKNGWFKYAGNWKQEHAPLAYRFQRWLLKNQKRKVTINGTWPAQPKHCITFENPCITHEELQKGINVIENKNYNNTHVTFCFVGRLEKEKGIDILIKSFARLSAIEKSKIDAIHVVGSGENMNVYKQMTANSNLNFVFHGFLSRSKVHDIYKVSHAIILPSASEGFPKVISEAMNYGCLPIVSNVSSLGHYVYDGINGFLFYPVSQENLVDIIKKVLHLEGSQFAKMIGSKPKDTLKFTYQYYSNRIKKEIIKVI